MSRKVKEETFTLPSNDRRTTLHGICWIPEGNVTAVMQLCHGMSEYIGRYQDFARYLAAKGILVVGHDHLGHGDSVVTEKDYGYFAKRKGNRTLIRDIHSVYKRTKKQYPDVPYILFGHSMGSFLARQYLCRYGEGLDGAVLCGTGHQPKAVLEAGLILSGLEAMPAGWRHRSRIVWWLSFGNFNKRFHPCRTESDWLCRNEETVDAYLADPKCGIPFTLNGYYNLFLGMLKISDRRYLECMPRTLPVLFIAGGDDPVGNFGKGVKKVVSTFREIGMEQVECRIYEGLRHEILNEAEEDRKMVYEDVYGWLEKI